MIILIPFISILINKLESETLNYTITQSKTNSKIFSKSVLNILMMNGGDIYSSSVDIKDMTSMLEPLMEEGLVYADAILLSSDPEKNGIILASLKDESQPISLHYPMQKIGTEEIGKMMDVKNSYRELPLNEKFIEFISTGNLPGKEPFCIARLIISKPKALRQITALKLYLNITVIILLLIAIILAFVFGEYIARPIIVLTDGVKEIESGN